MPKIPKLKLLVLCAGDPHSETTFSGSARGLIQALDRRGCVARQENVLGQSDPFAQPTFLGRVFRKIDFFGLQSKYSVSPSCLAKNTRRAAILAGQTSDFNACLMYGTNFHPKLDVPMYCYFDATVAQVAKARAWVYGARSLLKNKISIEYQKSVFESCTSTFPRSQYAAISLIEDYGLPQNKITVAGAGYNHNMIPPPHDAYSRKNILFVGVQFERKGGPFILEAFRIVRKVMPDASLTIVGCNPDINEPGVEIVGRIYKDNENGINCLLEYYRRASLFCIMSSFEPFGIVVVEAQNSYVPCVVPNKFAFTEMVIDGVTGVHLTAETAESLAQVMLDLLGDPQRLKVMGEAAHKFVQSELTWDKAAERIERRILSDLNETV